MRGQRSGDNGSSERSATPHSSARKGAKSPATVNRSPSRFISRDSQTDEEAPDRGGEARGVNDSEATLRARPKIESPPRGRGRARARALARAREGRDAPFSRTDARR